MTSKTKASHTPGPWEQGWYRANPAVFDSRGNGTIPIAICYDITTSSVEANAKLIAAAPELLEACKAALNFVDDAEVQQQVIDAIEKSTGE